VTSIAVVLAGVIVANRGVNTTIPPATPAQPETFDPFPPGYGDKVQRITALLEAAPTSWPSASAENELLEEAAHDSDFRIRVRAMAVLPFVRDREKAIDVLIGCLRDRASNISGGGNVPLYATTYLADMNAERAIPAVTDWIAFVQTKHPYDPHVEAVILEKNMDDLHRLRNSTTRPAS